MAAVKINTGEAYHEDRLAEAPREKWEAILAERRYYLKTNIDYDCRCLVQYVAEAEEFYAELGYDSAEALVQQAYEIQPEQAWAAVAYLEGRQAAGLPDVPVGMRQAVQAEHHATTAKDLEGTFAQAGDNQHTLKEGGPDIVRTNGSEGGNSAAYLAARLKKAGRDDLLEQIGPGKPYRSVRSAAIEAGIIKPVPTIRLVDDTSKVAAALKRHLSPDQLVDLVDALQNR
jgi:uncharacterized tellurite resistance protein B-like protein